MNWDAIGAIGEVVGALAVVITIIVLLIQVRQNTRSMVEANELQKASAIDKHPESIGNWRKEFIRDERIGEIWIAMRDGKELNEVDILRFDNMWVNFVNTQRSNFVRAKVVGEPGLSAQAVRSVALELASSPNFLESWEITKPWHMLASPDFVNGVDAELMSVAENKEAHRVPGSYKRSIHPINSKDKKQVES